MKAIEKAAISALTKIKNRAYTEAHRKIRSEYLIRLSDLNKAVKINKNASKAMPIASVLVEDKRIPLIRFFAKEFRQKGGGVLVQVKRSNPWRLIPHTFIATTKSGHRGIFERKVVGGKRAKRLPIIELTGPAAAALFGSQAIKNRITSTVNEEWNSIFEREYQWFKQKT